MAFSSLLAAALFCSPVACDQSFVGLESLPLSRGIKWDMARKSSKNKWDESKVSRGENGRFIAQSQGGHRENKGVQRKDAHSYLPKNNFDPETFQRDQYKPGVFTPAPVKPRSSVPKPVKPQRSSIFIQSGGQTYRR